MIEDTAWLRAALANLGLRELPGAPTEPTIARWLKTLGAWWRDDETPWCGTACAAWMRQAGAELPKHWYRAKGWLDWGIPLAEPVRGCVVVFGRQGGGHVGIVCGQDQRGRLLVVGGNQGDRVSVAPFDRARVLGYRWPVGWSQSLAKAGALPVIASAAASSSNEA